MTRETFRNLSNGIPTTWTTTRSSGRKKSGRKYSDVVIGLDFEVTSLFNINGKWQRFDPSIPQKSTDDSIGYNDIESAGIAYAWGMYVEGEVIRGRTLGELRERLFQITEEVKGTAVIYIHNLPYDFHFLLNIVEDFDVFARKPHKAMKAYSKQFDIEFRCSYTLTGFSLAKCAENYNLGVEKKVGDLDYNLERHPLTPLTATEWEYIDGDVIVLGKLIEFFRRKYNGIGNIPLTRTGMVRDRLKKKLSNKTKQVIQGDIFKSLAEFTKLIDTFIGGYTHANASWVGLILENLKSKDLTSAYPAVMLQCMFPHGNFVPCRIKEKDIDDERTCCMFTATFEKLKARHTYSYMSESKGRDAVNVTIDNGRVVLADKISFSITDVDFQIMREAYSWESVTFSDGWKTPARKLPNEYRRFIVDLFQDKTLLKGVDGKEVEYMLSKGDLNALYGMCCTNTIRDEVTFDGVDWGIQELTTDEVLERIEKAGDIKNAYVSFSWGVWVTAYARKRLWDIINKIDYDVVYTDTDSIKYIDNDHESVFEEFNERIRKLNDIVAEELGIPREKLLDMGEYDNEPTYDRFVTLGAKKYAYEIDGHIGLTVAGLNKNAKKSLKRLEDFQVGAFFGYAESGRKEFNYNNYQRHIVFEDYLGNWAGVNQQFGISMRPSTYLLGMSTDFEEYAQFVQNRGSTRLAVLNPQETINNVIDLL